MMAAKLESVVGQSRIVPAVSWTTAAGGLPPEMRCHDCMISSLGSEYSMKMGLRLMPVSVISR